MTLRTCYVVDCGMSAEGRAWMTKTERRAKSVYPDQEGRPTIGIGHLVGPGERFPDELTDAQIDGLFAHDLARYESAVKTSMWARYGLPDDDSTWRFLEQNEVDALVSFCFNVGVGSPVTHTGYLGSTLASLLRGGVTSLDVVAQQFDRWVNRSIPKWPDGMPELVRRRAAEKHLFLTGEYT